MKFPYYSTTFRKLLNSHYIADTDTFLNFHDIQQAILYELPCILDYFLIKVMLDEFAHKKNNTKKSKHYFFP